MSSVEQRRMAVAVHRAVGVIAEFRPLPVSRRRGRAEDRLRIASTVLLACGLGLMGLLFLAAVVHAGDPLSPPWMAVVFRVWVVGEAGLMASVLTNLLATLVAAFPGHRRYALDCSREWLSQLNQASLLHTFPMTVLDAVDQLFEQRIKRFERAQLRVLGGADKTGVFAVAGLGWATWKGLAATPAGMGSYFLVTGGGLLLLLVLGNLLASPMAERLRYYRDVIALARLGRA